MMRFLFLLYRNIVLQLSSRVPQMVVIGLTVGLLLIGNALLEGSLAGLRTTYVEAFTGDFSVSARGEEPFTVFGSDLPLIGEYLVTPPLPPTGLWSDDLDKVVGGTRVLPQVSASGILLLPGMKPQAVPIFGVNFRDYFGFFPSLKLVKGGLETDPRGGLMMNRTVFDELARTQGREPEIGDPLDLGMTVNGSFVIRTVRLTGVYAYSGAEIGLDRTVLTDPDTARALNGYTVGADDLGVRDPATTSLLGTDNLDSLFTDPVDSQVESHPGLNQTEVERVLANTTSREVANRPLAGTWNFMLLRVPAASAGGFAARLQDALDKKGLAVQVRDWVQTAGGNALVVALLQIVFSLGMGFLAFVASLIVMNSLALTVGERTREIGTMRALGASRSMVATMVFLETITMVSVSALAGLALASAVLAVTALHGISISNPVLISWLGTDQLRPRVSTELWLWHLGLTLALSLVACVTPVRRALAISPRKAMDQE